MPLFKKEFSEEEKGQSKGLNRFQKKTTLMVPTNCLAEKLVDTGLQVRPKVKSEPYYKTRESRMTSSLEYASGFFKI